MHVDTQRLENLLNGTSWMGRPPPAAEQLVLQEVHCGGGNGEGAPGVPALVALGQGPAGGLQAGHGEAIPKLVPCGACWQPKGFEKKKINKKRL